MKTQRRTEKHEYGGKTLYALKTQDTLEISERITYNREGKLTEIWIQYSDETSRGVSERTGKEIVYRDEVSYSLQTTDHWMQEGREAYERTNWSTGWQDSLEGKMKEAEIRQKALKYFAKRKKQLLGE